MAQQALGGNTRELFAKGSTEGPGKAQAAKAQENEDEALGLAPRL